MTAANHNYDFPPGRRPGVPKWLKHYQNWLAWQELRKERAPTYADGSPRLTRVAIVALGFHLPGGLPIDFPQPCEHRPTGEPLWRASDVMRYLHEHEKAMPVARARHLREVAGSLNDERDRVARTTLADAHYRQRRSRKFELTAADGLEELELVKPETETDSTD
ncbi:MAG: hypothetical protein ACLQME_11000 [Alphaproteobacteria bacterium]